MNRVALLTGLLCAALIAGGCGGAKRSATVGGASTSTASSSSIAAVSSSTTSVGSLTTASLTTRTRAATRSTPQPGGSVGHDGRHTGGSGGAGGGSGRSGGRSGGRGGGSGASNGSGASAHYARLQATFTIKAGGLLDPTAVSLPAVGAVRLAIVSQDAHAHLVLLRTPAGSRGLTVAPGGRASAVIAGVKPGRYVLDVDGLARGMLLVGGTPGAR